MLISILIYNSHQLPTAEYLQSFSGDFEIVMLLPDSFVPVSSAGSIKIIPLPENMNLQAKCLERVRHFEEGALKKKLAEIVETHFPEGAK